MSDVPEFISQAVLSRVREGGFVPTRRARRKSVRGESDRRRVFSPLAVTKRCIRYDPNVFTHRREQILQMAEALNDPATKMLLVSGLQGAGKTSLVRGVIELMGGRREQLLWFDVNRHTDFEEIIQFLIQYITYIGQSLQPAAQSPFAAAFAPPTPNREPLRELESLLRGMADVPLLIVLDNTEYIVDSDFRFNSYPFKEMLNFLLGFANIKMVVIGERLPYADISPNQHGVSEIKLSELSREDVLDFLSRKADEPPDPDVLARLCDKSLGMPWLLKLLYYLNRQLALHAMELERHLSEGESLAGEMTEYIFQNLSPDEQKLFRTLALLRHPVNFNTLLAMARRCYPDFDPAHALKRARQLEDSFIRPVLKISFPPQQVLAEIRESLDREARGLALNDEEKERRRHEPWYELYRQIKKLLYAQMSDIERARLHGILQDFYLAEKNRPINERISNIKSRALLSEAKHHSLAARKRREASAPVIGGEVPGSPPASPESRAYLARHTEPLSSGRAYTLEDYRSWSIEPSAGEPLTEGLELTEAERELLYGEGSGSEQSADPDHWVEEGGGVPAEASAKPESRPASESLAALYESASPSQSQPVDEAEKPLLETLAAAVARQDKTAFAHALLALGQHRLARGELARAEDCLRKAEGLSDNLEGSGLAALHCLQGRLLKETFRHHEAEVALLRAADCLPKASHPMQGEIYQLLGEIAAYRGQHARALEAFGKALETSEPMRQAEIHFAMAGVHDESGQPEQALAAYRRALHLEHGDALACAATLANMGSILLELERLDEAQAAWEESLAHDRKAAHPRGQIKTLESLALLHWGRGESRRAEAHLQQALALALQEPNRLWQANLYLKLGDLYAERGELAQARLQYGRAQSSGAGELSDASVRLIEEKLKRMEALKGKTHDTGPDESRTV